MHDVNLYIDESGNLGPGMGRYFLICALDIDSLTRKSISKRAGRVINRFKKRKDIAKTTEVKGSSLREAERNELIDQICFRGVKVRYIVLDLYQTTMLLLKADDKNACYNYLVQLLVKKVIQDHPSTHKINIYLDNRSVKIGNRLSLKPYLYNKLVLEQLENSNSVNRVEFKIDYLESESCYLIQWTDIIANSLYKRYNSKDSRYYDKIKPYIIFESMFPSKNFGK